MCLRVLWHNASIRRKMMRWSVAVWSLNSPGSRTLQWKKPESEGRGLEMEREKEDSSENLQTARYHGHRHSSAWHNRRHRPGTKTLLTCRTSCRSPHQQLGGSRCCGSLTEMVFLSPSTPRLRSGAPPPRGTAAPPTSRPLPPLCLWYPLTHKLHRSGRHVLLTARSGVGNL